MAQPAANSSVIALDVGNARVGVASASLQSRLPSPLTTLANDSDVFAKVLQLLASQPIAEIVVGLPRNLNGDATPQTAVAEQFAATLQEKTTVPIYFQDEALTSVKAEEELTARNKPYSKGDIDALAATYILEDYLQAKEQSHA